MGWPILLKLIAIFILTSVHTVATLTGTLDVVTAMALFSRDDSVCGSLDLVSCGQELPSNFCCASDTTCVSFNGGASAICCPAGQACNNIAPIDCNSSMLNATAFPTSPLHSTDLTGDMPSCGSGKCCPEGYSCQNNQCFLPSTSNPSVVSSATSSSPSSPSTSTSAPTSVTATILPTEATPTSSSASATQAAATVVSDPRGVTHCNSFPIIAVTVGFLSGLVAGALFAILIIVCIGRRRNADHKTSDSNRFAPKVSDPVYLESSNNTRTDFLRRISKSKTRSPRLSSLFSRSPTLVPKEPHTPDGIGRSYGTPENTVGLRKEPSMESIKIYSPPDVRLARSTRFSDMMERAGFNQNEPYLVSPERVDPRSRHLTPNFR
ncbi:hypothetical protein MMC14_004654 [Varicellaria rhodocarpa]|nr:hypothetical protein [Varicellaria rhodocarpa]